MARSVAQQRQWIVLILIAQKIDDGYITRNNLSGIRDLGLQVLKAFSISYDAKIAGAENSSYTYVTRHQLLILYHCHCIVIRIVTANRSVEHHLTG